MAAGALAAAPKFARADDAPVAGKPNQKAKTVQVLIGQGDAALDVKSYASARDTFSDALALDRANSAALVGEALAYMELGNTAKSIETIDRAADKGVPSRAVAINAAVIHIRAKDPTRAAKILRTYLSASATPHDERAYDLFITALSQFSNQAKQNNFYNACNAFAAEYAQKLAKDHPGQKLWGVNWLAADEADQKAADLKSQQSAIDEAEAKVASLDRQVNAAQLRYDTIDRLYHAGEATRYAWRSAEDQLDQIQTQEKTAQDAADDAMAKVVQTPLLDSVDPLMPGDADQVASSSVPPASSSDNASPPGTPAVSPATPAQSPPADGADTSPAPPPAPPKKVAVTNYAVAFAVAPTLAITDASAVKDSNSFSLQCPDGTVVQGTLLRTDDTGKLALLQLNKKVPYLDLAPSFTGGPVTCTGFPQVDIFNPTAEAISGTAPAPGDGWEIKLTKHPRLGGAPLTSGGKVVGVELAGRDSAINKIPAVSIDAVRSFVGSDLPAPGHGTTIPSSAIFQLVSSSGQ
ncbi:MAG TPA: hypothetical protein VHY37_06965 [Tepidisphaeraceae bacterium]|nr:hypothetical protein [Tepidisphaeraceae bacterium]